MNVDDVLQHWGILGMKWGVRRDRAKLRRLARQRGDSREWDAPAEDHLRKIALKSKRLSQMSNTELKDFTQRLQLEKQYKELTKKEISKGRKFVNDVLASSGKAVASNYVTKAATSFIDDMLKRASREAG